MSLVTMRILDADGNLQTVPLNDVSDTWYPVQQVAYGAAGSATLVSSSSPLPVTASFGRTGSVDAFGRLRTSNPVTIFDSKQLFDNQPLFWDEELFGTGGSSHSVANASSTLTTSASSDAVVRQTFMRFNYQPGKSQEIKMTFLATQQANVRKRIGYFEGSNAANSVPQNGIYLEVNETTVNLCIAKNGSVTQTVEQASWDDPMDGTGASGVVLDLNDVQILMIDLEWLGVGTARVCFVIDGIVHCVHEFQHANNGFSSVYMSSPNLPLNFSIYQSGAGSGSLQAICASVASEGGSPPVGKNIGLDMGSTKVTLANTATVYALLGIRLKAAYSGVTIVPTQISAIATSVNDGYLLTLRLNPTVADVFTFGDKTNSAIQTATGVAANTVTGGEIIWCGYGPSSSSFAVPLDILPRIGKAIDGTMDRLVLCAQPVTTNVDIYVSLGLLEQS